MPLGRETVGIPVSWLTAIASNSPSVTQMILSFFYTRFNPNRPLMWNERESMKILQSKLIKNFVGRCNLPYLAIRRFNTLLALVLLICCSDFNLNQLCQICIYLSFTFFHLFKLLRRFHIFLFVKVKFLFFSFRSVNGKVNRVKLLKETIFVGKAFWSEAHIKLLKC